MSWIDRIAVPIAVHFEMRRRRRIERRGIKSNCGFCGRGVSSRENRAYPIWRCACGALESGTEILVERREAKDALLEALGILDQACQPIVPSAYRGTYLQPFDSPTVDWSFVQILDRNGFEFREAGQRRRIWAVGRGLRFLRGTTLWAREKRTSK